MECVSWIWAHTPRISNINSFGGMKTVVREGRGKGGLRDVTREDRGRLLLSLSHTFRSLSQIPPPVWSDCDRPDLGPNSCSHRRPDWQPSETCFTFLFAYTGTLPHSDVGLYLSLYFMHMNWMQIIRQSEYFNVCTRKTLLDLHGNVCTYSNTTSGIGLLSGFVPCLTLGEAPHLLMHTVITMPSMHTVSTLTQIFNASSQPADRCHVCPPPHKYVWDTFAALKPLA